MMRSSQAMSLVFAALFLLVGVAGATTQFHLRVRGAWQIPQRFAFSLTCSDSLNRVTILNAQHDGVWSGITSEGWPLIGDLLAGRNPADTTIVVGGTFYAEIGATIQGFTRFDCDLDLSEQAPAAGVATSQFVLYWSDAADRVRVATDDPYGTNALAAIDITGTAGGELAVFYPLTFVAPDTLLLAGDVVGVPWPPPTGHRLRFSSVAPHPARGGVCFAFELPEHGAARLRIYDVSGRLIAEPLRAALTAGPTEVDWNLFGRSGRAVPPGVYIAELRFGLQTAVRRFVVAR